MTINFDNAQLKILNTITPIMKKWEKWQLFSTKPFGIYLYGPPGSGKTTLMDHLYNAFKGKKFRQHLKPFMLDLHQRGFAETISNMKRVNLICLDELEILDIADAMIFGRFLKRCQQHRIKLFFTTNLAPKDLYLNGLHRERFLPTIEFIEKNFKILKLDNNIDYRMQHVGSASDEILGQNVKVCVVDQTIEFDMFANGLASTNFTNLFGIPLGPRHYRWLAEQLDCLNIDNQPPFNENNIDVARRFITAIDLFYDLGKRIVLKEDLKIDSAFKANGNLSLMRAKSRLHEMKHKIRSHDLTG